MPKCGRCGGWYDDISIGCVKCGPNIPPTLENIPNTIQDNSPSIQSMIMTSCPFCSTQLRIAEATVQKIRCQNCNNSYHYPELTDSEKMVVALATINGSLRGISTSIWYVFFFIPLFVGFCLGLLIFIG